MKIKYLYHSTIIENLEEILNNNFLIPMKGIPVAGFEKDFISISDYLNDYLPIIFGNIIIEFRATNIFKNNILKPREYTHCEDFDDMPFEECEWIIDKLIFSKNDINKIIFIEDEFSYNLLGFKNICAKNNIKISIKNLNELPVRKLNFYKKRYFNRQNFKYDIHQGAFESKHLIISVMQ